MTRFYIERYKHQSTGSNYTESSNILRSGNKPLQSQKKKKKKKKKAQQTLKGSFHKLTFHTHCVVHTFSSCPRKSWPSCCYGLTLAQTLRKQTWTFNITVIAVIQASNGQQVSRQASRQASKTKVVDGKSSKQAQN